MRQDAVYIFLAARVRNHVNQCTQHASTHASHVLEILTSVRRNIQIEADVTNTDNKTQPI